MSARALPKNIVVPIVLALATNGLIFTLGWTKPDHDIQPSWAPPGYIIGGVWTVLFGMMGAARAYTPHKDRYLLTTLIVLCLLYPFYTLGLQDRMAGMIGIIITIFVALCITVYLKGIAPNAAWLLVPLIYWLCFALALVATVSRLNGRL